MINLYEGFDIATPGLKIDYRSAVLPTALPGPANMHACMYICVCMFKYVRTWACMCVLRRMDGRTEDGLMCGFKCVCVRGCAALPACV